MRYYQTCVGTSILLSPFCSFVNGFSVTKNTYRKNAFGLPRGTAYKKLEAAHLFQPAGNTRLFSEAGMSTLAREWATLNRDTDNASEPSGKTKIDKPLVAPQQQSNRAPDTALTASPINGSAPSSHNEYKNLAKEWASMNREDDSRSGPAPMPMPAPRTPPAPAAVTQASNPVPATPAAGANVYGNLAKEWASMNREDDSRSGPAPMPMPAPRTPPAPAAVTQASNPVPATPAAGANVYGNLAKEWASMNREDDSRSGPAPMPMPAPRTPPAPAAVTQASNPVPATPAAGANVYGNLAKEWASMNREDDSRSGPAPMPMPAPRTPPPPAAVTQASNPVPATPAAGANVYGNLAKEWASMNREDDSRSGPAPMPMPAPHAPPAPAAVTQASNPVPVSSSAGANIYGNLAKEWASMNREDDSRSGPAPMPMPAPHTPPTPAAVTQASNPVPATPAAGANVYGNLAKEWASMNREDDSRSGPAPMPMPAPRTPPAPAAVTQASNPVPATPAAGANVYGNLAKEWASMNREDDSRSGPAPMPMRAPHTPPAPAAVTQASNPVPATPAAGANVYGNLAKEWASMNREDDSRSGPAPMPMPAPRTPPPPAAVTQASNPVPATPAAGANVYGNLAKEWASMNREDDSRSGPAPMPMPAPHAPPAPAAVTQASNPVPVSSSAGANIYGNLAKEWASMNREDDSRSGPAPMPMPAPHTPPTPAAVTQASIPVPATPAAGANVYGNLAKEWASMNREDDSRSGPAPMPMPAPRTPPAPAAVTQASNPVPATPAAGANVYGNLAKEWASMNREDDSRSGPAPMPMPAPHAPPPPAAVSQASNPVPVSSSAGANIYGILAKEWASMNREDDSRSGPIPFTLPLVATNPAPIISLSPSETGTQSLVTSFDSLAIERADTNRKLDGTGLLVPHSPPGDPHATVKVTEGLIADLNSISIDYGIPDLEEMEVQVDAMINSLKRKDQEYHVTIAQLKAQYERQETELRVKLDTLATDYQAYRSSKESELLDKEKRVEGIKMGFQKELDDLSVKLQQQKELTDQESKRAQVYSARRSELENELSRLQSESAATIRDLENRYNAERDSRSDDLAVAKQRVEELQHESQQRLQEANKIGQEEVRRVKFDLQGRLENKEAELSKARTDLQGAEMDRKQNEARILALTDVNQSLQNVTKATFDLLNRIKKQIFGI